MRQRRAILLLSVAAAVGVVGCSGGDDEKATTTVPTASAPTTASPRSGASSTVPQPDTVVLNGQGNNLDAYAAQPDPDGTFRTQRVITTAADDPAAGLDINAQLCPFRIEGRSELYLIAGEDTGQPDPPPGWGIFRLGGDRVGELGAAKVGKLTPTYQPTADGAENYGCGLLSDGRILTTDVGNQASDPGDGQLIVWFPPYERTDVAYCKLDVTLKTAQSILVRQDAAGDDEVLVATARGGVLRYTGPFPTGPDPAGGCDAVDATGAPMASTVHRSVWLANDGANGMATPAGLAPAPDGGVYVSSVFTGYIDEYDADGTFRRTILAPPEGEVLGEQPFSTGTPLGIGVDGEGNLYYADIGVVIGPDGVGPKDGVGSVRRISMAGGEPHPPEVMGSGLDFPDGIGVITSSGGGGGGVLPVA